MDMKIKMPQEPEARVLLWTDITYHDMEKINQIQSIPEIQKALCEVLEIELPDPKRGILLDLYVQTILYCREKQYKAAQTSTLLSILKAIHRVNVETIMNNITHCHSFCKELLFRHSVRRPPSSIDLYNAEEVFSIYEYIYNTYLRHYRLYKAIFTPQVKLDLSLTYSDQTVGSTPDNAVDSLKDQKPAD
ncbi:unnamed protein product [Knipowitschia caucasica]|uniref:Uncharacterized protein n=1 Tax=Knipowitschia caucasica TaxID=637954 RepID=A0AAV2LDH7_KNICA